MDSTVIKVHPNGMGALKNWGPVHRKNTAGWNTKLHMAAASDRANLIILTFIVIIKISMGIVEKLCPDTIG